MGTRRAAGPLMAIGGGEDKEGRMEVLKEFVRLAGGPGEARVVVMTAPSKEPESMDETYRAAFESLGVAEVRVLVTEDRDEADRPRAVGVIDRATGVFITGGDQKVAMSRLRETKLEDQLRRRHAEGLLVGGTSAGASMLSEIMLDEGDSKECPRAGVVGMAEGLGLVTGMIIDQHFAQRGRLGRLLAALAKRPEALAVGIGEDTAMVVEGDTFTAVGRGVVTALDASKIAFNDSERRSKGEPLTLSGIVLHTIGLGHRFDLRARAVVADSEASPA